MIQKFWFLKIVARFLQIELHAMMRWIRGSPCQRSFTCRSYHPFILTIECIVRNSEGGTSQWIWQIECNLPIFIPVKFFSVSMKCFWFATINKNFTVSSISVALLKFFHPVIRKPDLPYSVIEWWWLVLSVKPTYYVNLIIKHKEEVCRVSYE